MTRRPRPDETIRDAAASPQVPATHTVGTAAFQKRVGEYLRRVAAGETIFVTDRHRVVAELRPPVEPPPGDHPRMVDPGIADMVRRGVLTLPTVVDGSLPPRLPPVATLDEILADLRVSRDSR